MPNRILSLVGLLLIGLGIYNLIYSLIAFLVFLPFVLINLPRWIRDRRKINEALRSSAKTLKEAKRYMREHNIDY